MNETTIFGATITSAISHTDPLTPTLHDWSASATTGLFSTSADLATEWQGYYTTMQNGQASSLTDVQRLEGNAEALFENTGLATVSAADQSRDRQDLQREFDAMSAAMTLDGISQSAPITTQTYLTISQTIQGNATLEELAMQGQGLTGSDITRYSGYISDFQYNVDSKTLYVGGGLDNNQNALSAFTDDVLLSHLPFPTIVQNGTLWQLDQNASIQNTLSDAAGALNAAATTMVLTASSFSMTAGTASSTPYAPATSTQTVSSGQMLSLTGYAIPTTVTANGHTWTADATGLYTTTADLETEWQTDLAAMQAGTGSTLTAAQFLEGNAEVVFENTGLVDQSLANLVRDRMDVQRAIDAMVGAMKEAGLDPNKPLTTAGWLKLEHTLQADPTLAELAVQGHGLNSPPSAQYNGYTTDFQNTVDSHTLYVGAGNDSGDCAIQNFFDDSIVTHAMFPTVVQNGLVEQLNQNGANESTLQVQVAEYNQFRFNQVLKVSDFSVPGTTAKPVAGKKPTVFGGTVASTITVNGDIWTTGVDGVYHTSTNLTKVWKGYEATMLAGNGATLTAIQRMEGNAEAVFDDTTLGMAYSAKTEQSFREDAAREFDAIGAAMTQLNLGQNELSTADYLAISQAIRSNAAWEELAIEGHGLNNPPSSADGGYTTGFQNNSGIMTYFVGGGLDNGENAISAFFDDVILTHLPYPTVNQNGVLEQLNQNGAAEDTLTAATAAMNETMFERVFVASDFSASMTATGAVVNVAYTTPLTTDANPVAGANQILSLSGQPVVATQIVNGHTWTADATGLYTTTTDLNLEWWNAYQASLAGGTLTLTQKWEAQAEAVFLNTGMSLNPESQQTTQRMDVQRDIDAIVATMSTLGLGKTSLTNANYLAIQTALSKNAALEQLAIEGVGLNGMSAAGSEYRGYVNDYNGVTYNTVYLGAGPNNGARALTQFFQRQILTELAFPTIMQGGQVTQLNQNGANAGTLIQAVQAINATLFGSQLTSANFGEAGAFTPAASTQPPPATITGFFGASLPGTVVENGHTWTADSNGVYQTTANLGIEWRTDYQQMLAGQGGLLTAAQRLEGNMEAFFENSTINTMSSVREAALRVDIQRVIDAVAAAQLTDQKTYGVDPTAAFSEASYLQLTNTIHGNAQLEELALQGVGMRLAPSATYSGAFIDVFGRDPATYFVGGGADNGNLAISGFVQDLLGNIPFETTEVNGTWTTTTANGPNGATALAAATLMNQVMYAQVFTSADFSKTATTTGPVTLIAGAQPTAAAPISSVIPTVGDIVTSTGALIANSMTMNGHVWTADANGLFHTTDLTAEWQGYYATMLAGNGATLTGVQRLEAEAEAVFEATGITALSAKKQQALREDVERQLDAEATAMQEDGITGPLTTASYLQMSLTMQSDNALEEMALQGYGVPGSDSSAYSGIVADSAGLSSVAYIGPGLNQNNSAMTFLQQNIMGEAAFAMNWGSQRQRNQNGVLLTASIATLVQALAASMGVTPLTKSSFK